MQQGIQDDQSSPTIHDFRGIRQSDHPEEIRELLEFFAADADVNDTDDEHDAIDPDSLEHSDIYSMYKDQLEGYFDFGEYAASGKRMKAFFRAFVAEVAPVMHDFLRRQLDFFETYYRQRAAELLISKAKLLQRNGQIENIAAKTISLYDNLRRREVDIGERERKLAAEEKRLAEERQKIQAIRLSLSTLLADPKQSQ